MIKTRSYFSIILIIFLLVASFILISCSSLDEKKADEEVDVGGEKVLTSLNITRGNVRLIINTPFIFKATGTDDNMFLVDNLQGKEIEWKVLNLDNTEATGVIFKDGIDNINEIQISFESAGDYKILSKWIDDTTDKEYKGVKKITIYESIISAKLITSITHDTPKNDVMNFKAVSSDNSKTFKWQVTKFNSIDAIDGIIATDSALDTTIDFTDQSTGRYILSLYVLEGDRQIDDYEGSILISDEDNFSIAIGDNHTLIADIKSDILYVYGVNNNGQLGTGSNDNLTTPTILKNKNIRFIKEVSAGKNHSLLLAGDGKDVGGLDNNYKVYSWGDNSKGQLGDDTLIDKNTPTSVSKMESTIEATGNINIPTTEYFDAIGAGGDQSFAYNNYKLAGANSGTVINTVLAQWGRDNSSMYYSKIPRYASEGPRGGIMKGDTQFLAVGTNHIVFRNTWASNLASFGSNSHGQIGKCDKVASETANCEDDITDIESGTGSYYGAGYKIDGFSSFYSPYMYAPRGESGAYVGYVEGVRFASAGDNFTLIIKEDGSLYTLGQNNKGQLGLGNDKEISDKDKNKFQPIKVFQGKGTQGDLVYRKEIIVDIATGYSHSYAIDKEGKLFAWGDNSKGQLLSVPSSTGGYNIPTVIAIPNVAKVLDIWAGANRSIALGNDRNLYTWGENKKALKLLGVDEVGTDKDYHVVPIKMMFPLAGIGH